MDIKIESDVHAPTSRRVTIVLEIAEADLIHRSFRRVQANTWGLSPQDVAKLEKWAELLQLLIFET